MPEYRVTIPSVDLVDEPIVAQNAKKAVAKALTKDRVLDSVDFDSELEVIVVKPSGKKSFFDAIPILSFRLTKAG